MSSWPDADALFRQDPRWLGSDDAYSIELSPGRTLWMFGDTFVGDGADPDRANAAFVRNTIGIMNGRDPSRAQMQFEWGSAGGAADSFFAIEPPSWLWPLDGAMTGSSLLLFFMLVRPSNRARTGGIEDWRIQGPLGFFDVYGWTAVRVENPADPPAQWRHVFVAPTQPSPIVLGAASLSDGECLYLYGWDAAKRIYLARTDAATGSLTALEWWCDGEWVAGGAPSALFDKGQTEFTVHRTGNRVVLTAVTGMQNAAGLSLRTAPAPQGPWSNPMPAFSPPEAPRADALVYAGKAHPHLTGAEIVATYASNSTADVTLKDDSLYYPRFARLSLPPQDAP